MQNRQTFPPIVIGVVVMTLAGCLCGSAVGVKKGLLFGEIGNLLVLLLLAILFGVAGFLAGGVLGKVWEKSGAMGHISGPTVWVSIVTGAVRGGLKLGGIGVVLGACLAALVYWDMIHSYVYAVEALDMALVALGVITVPAVILGVVGGGVLAAIRHWKGA